MPGGVIRRTGPLSAGRLCRYFAALAPADRRGRFCGSVSAASVRAYCADVDWLRTEMLAYERDGALCGLGELIRRGVPGMGGDAEAALSVLGPCQGRGVGTALFSRLMVVARNRGIVRVHLTCLADNRAMMAIARRFRARLAQDGDTATGMIRLEMPTYWTIVEEGVGELDAAFAALADLMIPASSRSG